MVSFINTQMYIEIIYFIYTNTYKIGIYFWKLKTLYKQKLRLFALDETRLDSLDKNLKY